MGRRRCIGTFVPLVVNRLQDAEQLIAWGRRRPQRTSTPTRSPALDCRGLMFASGGLVGWWCLQAEGSSRRLTACHDSKARYVEAFRASGPSVPEKAVLTSPVQLHYGLLATGRFPARPPCANQRQALGHQGIADQIIGPAAAHWNHRPEKSDDQPASRLFIQTAREVTKPAAEGPRIPSKRLSRPDEFWRRCRMCEFGSQPGMLRRSKCFGFTPAAGSITASSIGRFAHKPAVRPEPDQWNW